MIEHQGEIKRCPNCGKITRAKFPEGISQPVQYGPEIKAQMVYLNQYQLIPLERVSETLGEFYGQEVADGTIVEACQEVARRVENVNKAIKNYPLLG